MPSRIMNLKPEIIVILAGGFTSTFVEEAIGKIVVTVLAMTIGTIVSFYVRRYFERKK